MLYTLPKVIDININTKRYNNVKDPLYDLEFNSDVKHLNLEKYQRYRSTEKEIRDTLGYLTKTYPFVEFNVNMYQDDFGIKRVPRNCVIIKCIFPSENDQHFWSIPVEDQNLNEYQHYTADTEDEFIEILKQVCGLYNRSILKFVVPEVTNFSSEENRLEFSNITKTNFIAVSMDYNISATNDKLYHGIVTHTIQDLSYDKKYVEVYDFYASTKDEFNDKVDSYIISLKRIHYHVVSTDIVIYTP